MKVTSLRLGTRRMMQGSDVSNVAAMMGNTAFLAPLTVTSPCKGVPPLINKLSMKSKSPNRASRTVSIFHRPRNQDSRTAVQILLNCFDDPARRAEARFQTIPLPITELNHKSSVRLQSRATGTCQLAKEVQS